MMKMMMNIIDSRGCDKIIFDYAADDIIDADDYFHFDDDVADERLFRCEM